MNWTKITAFLSKNIYFWSKFSSHQGWDTIIECMNYFIFPNFRKFLHLKFWKGIIIIMFGRMYCYYEIQCVFEGRDICKECVISIKIDLIYRFLLLFFLFVLIIFNNIWQWCYAILGSFHLYVSYSTILKDRSKWKSNILNELDHRTYIQYRKEEDQKMLYKWCQ